MTVLDESLAARIAGMPPEAQAALHARLARMRADRADPHGPYGLGTRRWVSPGAMAAALDGTTRQTPLLDLLDTELVKVADGSTDRLMFYCPPQEGKSQRVSRRFVTWLLAMDPTLRIVIVSFEKERAARWGRWVKRDVEAHPELGIVLVQDTQAAARWQTLAGGGVYSVGVGGSLAGEPADVMIIDDPVKDRKAAESPLQREGNWDWWESVGQTRLSVRGRVVLITTRWHEDDLSGRLEARDPGRWRVVSVPAIAEAGDPLGRKRGEELVSVQNRPPGYFRKLMATLSGYVWRSIYQQAPTAAQGNLFSRKGWRYWHHGDDPKQIRLGRTEDQVARVHWTADLWRFATVDLAASTKTSADFTVCTAWGLTVDGDLVVLDRRRERLGESEHFDMVLPMVEQWALDAVFIERGFIGTTLVIDLTNAGVPVHPVDPDTDKITRAIPASTRQRQGRLWLPAGAAWLDEWINEHAQFPNSAHDDQVDTTSYAVRVAGAYWQPPPDRPVQPTDRQRPVEEGLDLAGAQW